MLSSGLLLSAVGLLGKAALWGIVLLACLAVTTLTVGIQGVLSAFGFLAETWLIQTAVGAWAAFRLQEISHVNQRRFERLRTTYDRKIEAVHTLYGRIEKRLYATRRYLSVIASEPALMAEERNQYREVVKDWNENVKLSQATILVEFKASYRPITGSRVFSRIFSNRRPAA